MGLAIGIDLGTTNTVAAYFDGERVRICDNSEGAQATPSVVAYNADGSVLVGAAAARGEIVAPTRTFRSVKRHMGTDWSATVDDATYTAVDASAAILAKVAADAADRLGAPVTDAVITVPAYFTDAARQATIDAGEIAGLNVLRIINEPTAAILAYNLDQHGTVAVFDVGGGTYDVSIVRVDDGIVEVLATAGDAQLGGDDLDAILVDLIAATATIDLPDDPAVAARLADAARQAKHTLTGAGAAHIMLPYLAGTTHLDVTVTRAAFDAAAARLYGRLTLPYRRALADSGLPGVDQLILVGGTTRVPAVAAAAADLSGRTPRRDINPDTCVAVGAAISAWRLSGATTPAITAGVGTVAIPSDSAAAAANLPAAADTVLIDVTGHSLGIDINHGEMSVLIARNTTIPAIAKGRFTTLDDNQTAVRATIYQGEHPRVAGNVELGSFLLDGLVAAPAGTAQIEVVFTIDADGVLHVSATDLATGASQSITLYGASAYSDDDIAAAKTRLDTQRARTAAVALESAAAADADALCERADALCESGQLLSRDQRKLRKAADKVRSARRKGRNVTSAVTELRTLLDTLTAPKELT